ncbi:Pentatricopeptide repeat-containing protein [Vigna angularis]|uniref:Pentatricopeptide repeat-containing protein n=1 Tax=Phaseolus angularis TaxID=3914 RepID=A0A8T0KT72_PHAAN|nr:Pentatricopeptide repeat-containing protein [Vigna angularis]
MPPRETKPLFIEGSARDALCPPAMKKMEGERIYLNRVGKPSGVLTSRMNLVSQNFLTSISIEESLDDCLSSHRKTNDNRTTMSLIKVPVTFKSNSSNRFQKKFGPQSYWRKTEKQITFKQKIERFRMCSDFKATHDLLSTAAVVGPKTLESAIDRLVRAGRPSQAVQFFERMERDYGMKRDRCSLKVVVEKLCSKGFASYAEKMVKDLAREFFPDEETCDLLIRGWCVDGKLEEAQRLAGEMYRGGFELGVGAYNAMLDCVCKLCREKDPFRLDSEVEKMLVEMDFRGVPRNVETFNVLITNLCKIRRTEDALRLFGSMGEWGCHPNGSTFLVLIRSLYQAARLEEGDEMIDRMRSAGYGEFLDKKTYYQFLRILCGIERIDHALSVFAMMKADGCVPGVKTYDLLMGKLGSHNRVDRANALFNEAKSRGLPVILKDYAVDPRHLKKKSVVKVVKKRETLPEKMARKRSRLKQIRLSFVKKPRRMMGR